MPALAGVPGAGVVPLAGEAAAVPGLAGDAGLAGEAAAVPGFAGVVAAGEAFFFWKGKILSLVSIDVMKYGGSLQIGRELKGHLLFRRTITPSR